MIPFYDIFGTAARWLAHPTGRETSQRLINISVLWRPDTRRCLSCLHQQKSQPSESPQQTQTHLNAANWPSARGQTSAAVAPSSPRLSSLTVTASIQLSSELSVPSFLFCPWFDYISSEPTTSPPQTCIISWTAWLRVWIRFSPAQFRIRSSAVDLFRLSEWTDKKTPPTVCGIKNTRGDIGCRPGQNTGCLENI